MLCDKPSRRDFLKGTGILIVGFSLPSFVRTAHAQSATAPKTVALDEVDAFLAIDPSGHVTLYSGKVELGTGVRTALTQIVAEELDVPLARVEVIEGDTALTPAQGPTWGSLSIQVGGMQIRQAAATARQALLQDAAKRLDVPAADLVVEQGTVRARSGGKQAVTTRWAVQAPAPPPGCAAGTAKDGRRFSSVGRVPDAKSRPQVARRGRALTCMPIRHRQARPV